jgi:hypothetical protein
MKSPQNPHLKEKQKQENMVLCIFEKKNLTCEARIIFQELIIIPLLIEYH